jgi:DNA-directed RNA polymerase subunit RPC12/RpoP
MNEPKRVKVACQTCSATFAADEGHNGRLVQCPRCGGSLFVICSDKVKAAPDN